MPNLCNIACVREKKMDRNSSNNKYNNVVSLTEKYQALSSQYEESDLSLGMSVESGNTGRLW